MVKRTFSQAEASQALAELISKRAKRKSVKAKSTRYGQSVANARRQMKRSILPVIRNPLPIQYKTTVTYPPKVFTLTGAGGVGTEIDLVLSLNDVYAFDYNGVIGNIQPLYLDQLLSSTGPYKRFKVTAWRCKLTVDNLSQSGSSLLPLDVIIGQGYLAAADCDSFAELSSLPNTQRRMLQWYGGGPSARAVMEMNGTLAQFAGPQKDAVEMCGTYSASPSQIIFGALTCQCADSSKVPTISIQVHCEMDVTFYSDDGAQS